MMGGRCGVTALIFLPDLMYLDPGELPLDEGGVLSLRPVLEGFVAGLASTSICSMS